MQMPLSMLYFTTNSSAVGAHPFYISAAPTIRMRGDLTWAAHRTGFNSELCLYLSSMQLPVCVRCAAHV